MLLTVWALTGVSHLPASSYSFLRYSTVVTSSSWTEYSRHHYLIELGFLITRIIGYSITARWLFKAGPEVEQLLLPETEAPAQN
jgi:hypothetical protein